MTREGLDLAINQDDLPHTPSSRTVTFTLGSPTSSLSSSSLCSQQNESTSIPISEDQVLEHSQSFTLEDQRRRPVIEDPYKLSPNLEVLNDWMITTTGKSRRELSETHGFSEDQIAVFEESFSLLDRDGDGTISNSEIRSLMNSLGYSPSHEDISSVISKVDIDGNGSVDFDEFLIMMQRRKSTGGSGTELLKVFNVFDKNKDGFIDKNELYDMLLRLGEQVTEEDVTEMIEEADCLDNDGKVSYEEFKAILSYSK
ncbi:unnamed protein product [Adineta steineri]|uniref:EF-hand domain-containing protein n=1 Tax=Adineta steineri TaxID=433720 RepID=A0A819ZIS7_9BILA|nr:unnamed protein product [Adineta steineri]CAF4032586.1 unnamed protein product [Adineta steineri]CAF4175076.1 unnamed protein product [Adineta steineri]